MFSYRELIKEMNFAAKIKKIGHVLNFLNIINKDGDHPRLYCHIALL